MTDKINNNENIKKTQSSMKIEEVTPAPEVIDIKARNKELVERKRLADKKEVRGMFKFFEIQGGELSFSFNAYKGDPRKKYTLQDGQTYVIPMGVARHLNTSGWWPVHEHSVDAEGKPKQIIGKKVRRYGFFPLDFADAGQYDNQDKNIITANML
jgi:hypothetical protein